MHNSQPHTLHLYEWILQVYRVLNCFSPYVDFLPHVLLQVVELISGGAQIAVTNENKMHYLNLLAQYRLASQVRDEVEHFLKGKETSTAAVSFI